MAKIEFLTKSEAKTGDKVPPHSLEAEQSLLGALVLDKDAIVKVADIINPDDFYKDAHRYIYEAMQTLYEKREPIDLLSLGNLLGERKQLDIVGGKSYLSGLANAVPTSSHVVNYAKIISKKATLRRLIHSSAEIADLAFDEDTDISETLDKSEQSIFAVSQKFLKRAFNPIKDILVEAFDRIDEIHKESGKLRGIPTGYNDLDNILGGLQKSDLVILAARPSMGKTTLAMDIARNVALKNKIPVAIYSLEMSKEQLVDRLLCSTANVDLWKMRTGKLSDHGENDDFTRIGQAMGLLSEAPIYIDDTANSNIMEIRTKARRLQSEHGLGLILIDYLQLMESFRQNDNRVQEVSEISRNLKAIARELNVPVLALSQLSRGVESRESHIPRLADLRESGSIEQDADVVMFIYREAMYHKDLPPDKQHLAEVYVAKHRNGPTGKIQLFFDENAVTFKSLSK
ncbi:MAG: replicative DNA helicase [Candidatus Buchananbacteria bacterium CG10_big_fil_rev_8_21_14_0_10_42_9]|uniref:Replicative DNA helicase n=1 Tax=Candidatus Buchananbacteria bacterium CG10_big_fil_rev_8_21_14_0_10_42_9 TaxID=1974526 RepID=A0A2H0W1C4_9BACT|nr:MAG: replicative DNA helicase [Candidatus Buchananbacteria bacterium CG10_big_fil_rev_8_21_14_0_10_42_9]